MPGYGIVGADQGSGLLSWSWATERLARSHDYWLATICADGRPHVMPVWAVWEQDALWFSSSNPSQKARNLGADPRCTMTTDDPLEPVIVQGRSELVTDLDTIAAFIGWVNAKYETDYSVDFLDPTVNSSFRLAPSWAFGLASGDFTGSPTRWTFDR
jgi:hypothetical protein